MFGWAYCGRVKRFAGNWVLSSIDYVRVAFYTEVLGASKRSASVKKGIDGHLTERNKHG